MSTLSPPQKLPPILTLGLRPFFLAAGLFATLAILLWLATLHGIQGGGGLYWHAHEMLYGFVGAAIGGFLLTAVPNWTGRQPPMGLPLLGLVMVWVLARLPLGPVAAVLDVSYWLLLAGWVARQLIASGNRNNLPMVGILTLMGLLNGLYYAALAGVGPLGPLNAIYLALHLVLMLVAVIGGRIIPSFTRNWLAAKGREPLPVTRPRVEVVALALVPLTGLADGLAPGSAVAGVLALAAALAHGVRLSGWRGLKTFPEWLLTVLHVGYGWLVVGYLLLGLAAFGVVPRSAALHALTMGAMGTMILAVMARAALGHTGRKLHAGRALTVAFVLVGLATVLRVAAALLPQAFMPLVDASGTLWIAAFGLFAVLFWPVLTRPRADGQS